MYFLGVAVGFLSAFSSVALELVLWLSLLGILGCVRFAGQAELRPVVVLHRISFMRPLYVGVFSHSSDMDCACLL